MRASNGEDTRNEDSHFRFPRVSFDGLRKKERLLVVRVLCTAKWDIFLLKCMMYFATLLSPRRFGPLRTEIYPSYKTDVSSEFFFWPYLC